MAMAAEKVPCCKHGFTCLVKTGTRQGTRNYGRSFYVCPKVNDNCKFVEDCRGVPPMFCPRHGGAIVSLRKFSSRKPHLFSYRCTRQDANEWCGSENLGEKENIKPELVYENKKKALSSTAEGVKHTSASPELSNSSQPAKPAVSSTLPKKDGCGVARGVNAEHSPVPSLSSGGSTSSSLHESDVGSSPSLTESDSVLSSSEIVIEEEVISRPSAVSAVPEVVRQDSVLSQENSDPSSSEAETDDEVVNKLSLSGASIEPPINTESYYSGFAGVRLSDPPASSDSSVNEDACQTSAVFDCPEIAVEERTVSQPLAVSAVLEAVGQGQDSVLSQESADSSSSESDTSDDEEATSQLSPVASASDTVDSELDCSQLSPGASASDSVDSEPDCDQLSPGASASDRVDPEPDCGQKSPVASTLDAVDPEPDCGQLSPVASASDIVEMDSEPDCGQLSPVASASHAVDPEPECDQLSPVTSASDTVDPEPDCIQLSPVASASDVVDGVMDPEPDCGRKEPEFKLGHQYRTLVTQYQKNELMIKMYSHRLPDGGASLREARQRILQRMTHLRRPIPPPVPSSAAEESSVKFHSKTGNLTQQAKMLTAGAVEHLHSSLASCPTEEELAEDPPGLTVELMAHQRRGLAWMLWRETQTPSGGILADDMGLGKTLSMIALVLKKKREDRMHATADPPSGGLVRSSGTLVVCPASVMNQWQAEVGNRVSRGLLSLLVYHGPARTKSPRELAHYDFVITTFNLVNVEYAGYCPAEEGEEKPKKRSSITTLFGVHWERVILDEAHVIRNPRSGTSIGACRLVSVHHWAVTGTPIQNNLKDFYSLIRFIQLAPFDDMRVWKDTVERRGSIGMQRLNTMVSSLVLRRTKEEMTVLKLTRRIVEVHSLQLPQEQQEVYDVIFHWARQEVQQYVARQEESDRLAAPGRSSGPPQPPSLPPLPPDVMRVVNSLLSRTSAGQGKVFTYILRLRQVCGHLNLLTASLEKPDMDELEIAMDSLSIDDSHQAQQGVPERFQRERMSCKMKQVMKLLQDIMVKGEKSIIVSQWTTMLDIMQHHLSQARVSYTRIDGSIPPRLRGDIVERFNTPGPKPAAMLLSLQAGGVGLNLMGANHVFMLDMHWNPALEQQAADRCHRVGQPRDVFIHRFVCTGTFEERILQLQEKKIALSRNVLSGASSKARQNKLSLSDLKHLFDL